MACLVRCQFETYGRTERDKIAANLASLPSAGAAIYCVNNVDVDLPGRLADISLDAGLFRANLRSNVAKGV